MVPICIASFKLDNVYKLTLMDFKVMPYTYNFQKKAKKNKQQTEDMDINLRVIVHFSYDIFDVILADISFFLFQHCFYKNGQTLSGDYFF